MASPALSTALEPFWKKALDQIGVIRNLDTPSPVYILPSNWAVASADQAKSRVDRKTSCDWTLKPTFKYLDPADLDKHVAQMVDIKKSLDRFGKGMITDQAIYRGGWGDYNFVQAFMEAMDRTPHYGAGEIIPPNFRNHELAAYWLFGPQCETVSYAKVQAIKDYENGELLYKARAMIQHGDNFTLDFKLRGVEFEARLLTDPYHWPAPNSSYEFHIRFKTYKDMAAWADMASHDRTRVQIPERY